MEEEDEGFHFAVDKRPDWNAEKKVPVHIIDYYVEPEESEDPKKITRSAIKCWNCGGGHAMHECKSPRNHAEVARNRRAFMKEKEKKGGGRIPKRYHLQPEQKYAKFRPGVISKKLRQALRLYEYQLPKYIYRMRILGYPPGWLQEAQILPSSLQMYNGSGERVPDPDDEEGEIESSHVKYNLDMIIDYPGFNCMPPAGTIEEGDIHNVPPMRHDQSKDMLIAKLKFDMNISGNKSETVVNDLRDMDTSDEDMDAEEIPETIILPPEEECTFVPPLPCEDLPPPPSEEPPPPGEEEISKITFVETDNDTSSDNQSPGPNVAPKLDPYANLGKVKSVYLGTPVLKSASPYSKVPSIDSFRKNMGQVLTFENLENSTGTYEKMNQVLQRVRENLSSRR